MLGGRKVFGVLLSLVLLLVFAMPVFAADRDVDPQMDLHGVPRLSAHRWMAATAGGAGIGAALGVLIGGGNDITKGILFGGGAASSLYLMSHRNAAAGWRDWAFVGSNTALGTGIGWTLCGCDDGAVAGALIGGGGTAFWRAFGGRQGVQAAVSNAKQTVQQDISH
jgi:hypothetical protein